MCCWPLPAEQKFLRLRVACEAQREIFFENAVNGDADAVFVGARFRFDGESDGRLGNTRGRIEDWSSSCRPGFRR